MNQTTYGNRVTSGAIVASGQTALTPAQIQGRANVLVWTAAIGTLVGAVVGTYVGMTRHH